MLDHAFTFVDTVVFWVGEENWRSQGAIYFVAAFLAIITEGVWSAKHLTSDRLLSALMIYGAFALLFLVVPAVVITAAGSALLERSRTRKDAYLAQRIEALSEADRAMLVNLLPLLERLQDEDA